MKIAGFNFTRNDFRYCILDGTTIPPTIIEKNKIVYPNNMDTSDLMEWFETQPSLIIDKHQLDQIAHKISLNLTTLDQVRTSCYPQAILNLLAKKRNIPINNYSASISPLKTLCPRYEPISSLFR